METITNLTTSTAHTAPATTSSDPALLGQSDFLQLMTTQLQNQDPFKPMENGEFLGQMAQFSTVSGIESMNASLQQVVGEMGRSQLSDAATMLGRSVLVPGTMTRPDATGAIRGQAVLNAPSESVTVTFTDPTTFDVLHVQDLGPQPRGALDITWNDPPAAISSTRGDVRINVQTGDSTPTDSYVYARVDGVTLDPTGGGQLVFNVEDYGLISDLEISAIR